MKQFLVVATIITLVLAAACQKHEKASGVDIKIKGQWKVIAVNCMDILAEKEGKRKIFTYQPPEGQKHLMDIKKMLLCRKDVKPGWIIQVESEDKYALFPPPALQIKAKESVKPKK